jgi:FlaA1/EpsC-like NDP-sugar epimerase
LHVVPRALVQLVPVLESLDRRAEANEALEDALAASDPEHTADVGVDLAAILESRRERSQAIEVLRSVVDNWQEQEESARDVGDMMRAIAALRLGTLLAEEGDGEGAQQAWRQALNSNYPAITPVAALRLADALTTAEAPAQKPAEIEELYRVAIDFGHPTASPEAALRLARHLADAGQAKKALELCGQVLRTNGKFVPRAKKEIQRLDCEQQRVAPRPRTEAKRWLSQTVNRSLHRVTKRSLRTLIVGAGTGGRYLHHDLPKEKYHVLGWLDDHPPAEKILGFPVFGELSEAHQVFDKLAPDVVLIAIPTLSGEKRGQVVNACLKRDIPVLNLPSMFELVRTGNIALQLREVLIEETVGNRPMEIDRRAGELVRGRNVLITGAGDTLGEELCRQIAHARARHLALVDDSAVSLQGIADELRNERLFERAFPVLGGCAEEGAMKRALSAHLPHIVFHAPSHAHASLFEMHPIEAVRTNVFNTWAFARACGEEKVRRFVLVSSKDAASLRGVFDTTQVLAEHAIEAVQEEFPSTDFVTVRVGNLYRSSGSVVEIFEKQIKHGQPVTLTDEHAARRFMRVQLAAQLLLRVADTGAPGRTYAIHGGDFLRIKDLAERMIRLRGHEPGKEIPLAVVGPRSWERQQGPLVKAQENEIQTELDEVSEVRRRSPGKESVEEALNLVKKAAKTGEPAAVLRTLTHEVPQLLETRLSGPDAAETAAESRSR